MYSILIRDSSNATMYSFYVEDEVVFKGTKTEVEAKVKSLLNTITLGRIKVVHNTTLEGTFTVTDVTEA